MTQRSCIV